jgi:hypothetical protein
MLTQAANDFVRRTVAKDLATHRCWRLWASAFSSRCRKSTMTSCILWQRFACARHCTNALTHNAIERRWGVLENHGNGAILDSVETTLRFARTMTWNGKHPLVQG